MTRKTKAAIERSCYNKQRYGTSRQVQAAAERVKKRSGREMDYYPCLNCGGWHLTSK